MNARWKSTLMATVLCAVGAAASAQVFSGRFDDPLNAALVASNLGAAQFVDEFAIANNLALYDLSVPLSGMVTIASTGFASGGADPYFSLFAGWGDTATFVASNYDTAFSSGGDFSFSTLLAAGAYQLAIGVFANLSFAENYGSGTLAEGFIGLGTPGSMGDGSYHVVVTTAVPEPTQWVLLCIGLVVVVLNVARERRVAVGH